MSFEKDKTIFCNNVKTMWKKQGLKLEELARRSGLPLKMLEELEQGTLPEEMILEDAVVLAKIFGCEVYELFK